MSRPRHSNGRPSEWRSRRASGSRRPSSGPHIDVVQRDPPLILSKAAVASAWSRDGRTCRSALPEVGSVPSEHLGPGRVRLAEDAVEPTDDEKVAARPPDHVALVARSWAVASRWFSRRLPVRDVVEQDRDPVLLGCRPQGVDIEPAPQRHGPALEPHRAARFAQPRHRCRTRTVRDRARPRSPSVRRRRSGPSASRRRDWPR